MHITGITGIEDKLQDEIPQTIEILRSTGIKVWILTGDKMETAINIGFACKLLEKDMTRIEIDYENEANLALNLEDIIKRINSLPQHMDNYALIITGDSLMHIELPNIPESIMAIAKRCKVVICCRVSPQQKQKIVQLVRKLDPTAPTLAIGDGANDVNMITAAHVGIGIRGVEGQQAARASDYNIDQFKYLRNLLFFHGRECYRRNAALVCYNFFKNTLLVLPQFWYGLNNFWSGQTLYDSYLYQLFNILFSSLPIMVYAIFDQEYKQMILVENDRNYYEQGMKKILFGTKQFWIQQLLASGYGLIIVALSFLALEDSFCDRDGKNLFFWGSGLMVFGLVVVVSNMKIIVISHTISAGSFSLIILSIFLYGVSWGIVQSIVSQQIRIYRTFDPVMSCGNYHIGNICVVMITFAFDQLIEKYQKWRFVYQQQKNKQIQNSMLLFRGRVQQKFSINVQIDVQDQGFNGINLNDKMKFTNKGFAFSQIDVKEDQTRIMAANKNN